MESIHKSGAIVTSSENRSKILLLYRLKHDDWTFPKGKAEPGEDSEATMRREVHEETGLTVDIISKLPELNYRHKSGKPVTLAMYQVRSVDDNRLRAEHTGDILKFMPVDEVEAKLTYKNLKAYFRSVKTQIAP